MEFHYIIFNEACLILEDCEISLDHVLHSYTFFSTSVQNLPEKLACPDDALTNCVILILNNEKL